MTKRIAALAAAAVVTATAVVVVPATPAHAAACPRANSGVTVVVDFSALGGGVEVACAPGDPASGLAALQGAGFSWTGTLQFPAFVCRIDGLPTPSDDACRTTSPSDAYWAYYHAPRDGSWSYSSSGPASRNPAPGTVEGWAFGAGAAPDATPPAAAPPPAPPPPANPPPPPPPAASEQDGGGSSNGGSSSGGSSSGGSSNGGSSSGDSSGGSGERSGTDGGTEPGSSSRSTDRPADPAGDGSAAPTTPAGSPPGSGPGAVASSDDRPGERTVHTAGQESSGGLAGVVVAVGLVAALAAGAFWVQRRRSTREPLS